MCQMMVIRNLRLSLNQFVSFLMGEQIVINRVCGIITENSNVIRSFTERMQILCDKNVKFSRM